MALSPFSYFKNKATGGGGGGTDLINADLIAVYELEEANTSGGVADESSNNNDGTFPGGSNNPTVDVAGKLAKCYSFVEGNSGGFSNDGTWFTCHNNCKVTDAFTIAFWIYPHGWNTSNTRINIIGGQGLGASNESGGIAVTNAAGNSNIYFDIYDSGGRDNVIFPISDITANQWTHVVWTWTGGTNGTISIYLNASLHDSATTSDVSPPLDWSGSDTGDHQVGDQITLVGTSPVSFDGLIDQYAVWSKVLSATDISDLYNSGSGLAFSNW